MKSRGSSTIGDTLSKAMKLKLEEMMFELQKKASETIARQLGQPKPPLPQVSRVPKDKVQLKGRSTPTTTERPVRLRPAAQVITPKADHTRRAEGRRIVESRLPQAEFSYWTLPAEASVREVPPSAISPLARRAFQDLIGAGTKTDETVQGEDLFVNVGLDFGTSSTKVIVRLPYEPGEPTVVIPAPGHCRSESHPYLWQTVLWMRPNGEFMAWPEAGAAPLHALKQSVIDGRHDKPTELGKWNGPPVSRAEAAVAYLAYVIRYTRGWLTANRAKMLVNRRLVWSENIGLPVATLDDGRLVEAYRRIGAAAHLAASFEGDLTVDLCRAFLDNAQVIKAAKTSEEAANFGIAAIPETAAEATGFFKSSAASEGAYLMVDVGAMTLDACMFGYLKGGYKLFNAMVKPLGVESFHWFMQAGKSEEGFVDQCRRCLWGVVWHAKTDHIPQVPCWNPGRELPVFLVGGGAQNHLHQRVVNELRPWLKKHTRNNGIRLLDVRIPRSIDLPEPLSEFGRLAVAWGLSYPADQIGEFSAPSSIAITPPLPHRQPNNYISKDQV